MREYRAAFPSTYEAVGKARHAVLDFARLTGFGGSDLDDLECAIGEALANAAEHGRREGAGISVSATLEAQTLTIEVRDSGPGFPGWNATDFLRPMSDAPRGFGIFIMRALMDKVEYTERGRHVRLTKKMRPAPSAPCRTSRGA
jgi:anti-sigma regulatory factor (Ser/Thr protein kinase)